MRNKNVSCHLPMAKSKQRYQKVVSFLFDCFSSRNRKDDSYCILRTVWVTQRWDYETHPDNLRLLRALSVLIHTHRSLVLARFIPFLRLLASQRCLFFLPRFSMSSSSYFPSSETQRKRMKQYDQYCRITINTTTCIFCKYQFSQMIFNVYRGKNEGRYQPRSASRCWSYVCSCSCSRPLTSVVDSKERPERPSIIMQATDNCQRFPY